MSSVAIRGHQHLDERRNPAFVRDRNLIHLVARSHRRQRARGPFLGISLRIKVRTALEGAVISRHSPLGTKLEHRDEWSDSSGFDDGRLRMQ